ncbi:hypothetical protein LPJCHP_LPJCHP_11225, partial [Dysosmobacter welbionis]
MAHGSQRYQAGHGILHDEPVLGIGRVAQSAIGFDALNQIIQAVLRLQLVGLDQH